VDLPGDRDVVWYRHQCNRVHPPPATMVANHLAYRGERGGGGITASLPGGAKARGPAAFHTVVVHAALKVGPGNFPDVPERQPIIRHFHLEQAGP
jgi:hypothetical protein